MQASATIRPQLEERASDATVAKMKFITGMLDGLENVTFRIIVDGNPYDVEFDGAGNISSVKPAISSR